MFAAHWLDHYVLYLDHGHQQRYQSNFDLRSIFGSDIVPFDGMISDSQGTYEGYCNQYMLEGR